jgi:hypothetical protein
VAKKNLRVIAWIGWATFVLLHLLLLAGLTILPGWLMLLVWGGALCIGLVLLIYHNRALAQWRAVGLLWVGYSGLRLLAVAALGTSIAFLRDGLSVFAMMLAIEAMLAGWFAIVWLSIRRDVSVTYLVSALVVGTVLLRSAVQASGGVMNFLIGESAEVAVRSFSLAEPLLMSFSCMTVMGLLTFFPHLLWLGYREMRGR